MRNLKEIKIGEGGKIQGNEIHNLILRFFTEETLERFEWVEK